MRVLAVYRRIGMCLALGALGLVWAGAVALTACGPAPTPTSAATPLPSFTPWQWPTPTPWPGTTLLVRCNVPATLRLANHDTGLDAATGRCTPHQPQEWPALPPGTYFLYATSEESHQQWLRQVLITFTDRAEVSVGFPGILEVIPVPRAIVHVGKETYLGHARLSFPAEQCPLTVTVTVETAGFRPAHHQLRVEGGHINRYTVTLEPAATPFAQTTPRPAGTPRPASPPQTVWTQEKLLELSFRMWQYFNQVRQEIGRSTLEYDSSLQAAANEVARQFYVTNMGLTFEEANAITAPGKVIAMANNSPLQGGACNVPPDKDPAKNNAVRGWAYDLPDQIVGYITIGFYGPYIGHCGLPSYSFVAVVH